MLQVGHPCGLCNRLDSIATGYLLARERGEKDLEVIWPINNQMPASFYDLFTALPHGRVVECNLDPRAWGNYHSTVWRDKELMNDRDLAFFTEMLARLVANVVPEIQAKVSAFAEEHFAAASRPAALTVGVHIRRLEPAVVVQELYPGISRRQPACTSPDSNAYQLCEFAQPLRYYEAMMKSFPRDTRFFVSTDSEQAFRWLQSRFDHRVFERPKVSDRTSVAGVRESFMDLLLLSRCMAVIGTGRSSFSHTAARIGRRPVVAVSAFPRIPVNWPCFNRWHWLWAYRHFLVESTFWRRWLFFDVRPYALLAPRIPGRCMRIARTCASRIATYFTKASLRQPPDYD